ncbi:MAG: COG1361 S-layer family protein [Methanosarcinaceae archaeon]|nr:COG1361 S-layer family protein [Methanosarcinaceae archaeon]
MFILFVLCMPANAADGADLQATILRYEPIPAEIGEYVTMWVKVENLGYAKAENVQVRIVPEYPFSPDSPGNAIKYIGILSPDNAAVEEFRLFVDSNAKEGIESIEIWYQEDTDNTWYKKEFDIRVGSTTFDSRGNVQLQGSPIFEPEVFMPGDHGTVMVTLANTATTDSVTVDGEVYDTNARVQAASLEGDAGIDVTTDTYYGNGVIGPGESISLTYNIMVADDVEDGTYYLELSTVGNSHAYNNNWRIPVRVDSSCVRVIPSTAMKIENGEGTLEFDIANIHPNVLSSVSITLEAEGFDFTPAEYFIGTMESDELFTIEFDASAIDGADEFSSGLSISADYRNGQNEHVSIVNERMLQNHVVREDSGSGIAIAAIVLLAIAAGGYMMYRRRKNKE